MVARKSELRGDHIPERKSRSMGIYSQDDFHWDAKWGTAEELRHIKQYLNPVRLHPANYPVSEPSVLLQGYIKASQKRVIWEKIDKEKCIDLAEELLEKCEGC